jgi:uncharacterized membrane protein YfcA
MESYARKPHPPDASHGPNQPQPWTRQLDAGQRGGHWGTAGLGDEAGEVVVGVYDGLAGVGGGGVV